MLLFKLRRTFRATISLLTCQQNRPQKSNRPRKEGQVQRPLYHHQRPHRNKLINERRHRPYLNSDLEITRRLRQPHTSSSPHRSVHALRKRPRFRVRPVLTTTRRTRTQQRAPTIHPRKKFRKRKYNKDNVRTRRFQLYNSCGRNKAGSNVSTNATSM